jgi:hypothetical protein
MMMGEWAGEQNKQRETHSETGTERTTETQRDWHREKNTDTDTNRQRKRSHSPGNIMQSAPAAHRGYCENAYLSVPDWNHQLSGAWVLHQVGSGWVG